jgi:hypothetical protein
MEDLHGCRRQRHFLAELVGRRVLVPGPMCKEPGRHSTPQSALADLRPVPVAGRRSAGRLVIRQQIRDTCPPTDPQQPRSLAPSTEGPGERTDLPNWGRCARACLCAETRTVMTLVSAAQRKHSPPTLAPAARSPPCWRVLHALSPSRVVRLVFVRPAQIPRGSCWASGCLPVDRGELQSLLGGGTAVVARARSAGAAAGALAPSDSLTLRRGDHCSGGRRGSDVITAMVSAEIFA